MIKISLIVINIINTIINTCCVCCSIQDYELRKVARSEGRLYCDPAVLTYQAERMPEQLRLKVCEAVCNDEGSCMYHTIVLRVFI